MMQTDKRDISRSRPGSRDMWIWITVSEDRLTMTILRVCPSAQPHYSMPTHDEFMHNTNQNRRRIDYNLSASLCSALLSCNVVIYSRQEIVYRKN